ncbi:MAG: Fic family protein [Eubacteriales bacterium]
MIGLKSLERLSNIPISIVRAIAKINEYKGKQDLFYKQSPEILKTLQEIAEIQSTESSNRIEGIKVSNQKLKEIMSRKTTPRDRSEAEISGYRDILATIHASAIHIPVKPQVILQLHRDMYKYLPQEGGAWKPTDNVIEETLPDGTKRVRFVPVKAFLVTITMDELCCNFNTYREKEGFDDLILSFAFILDFLCIHPFRDGNGRISRLLTLLLLYQAGFEVGRFISLERIIEESKETYYDALERSSQGWHEKQHDPIPWIEYSLGVLIAAYKEFEERVKLAENQRGSKTTMIKETILHFRGDFSIQDIEQACPNVSRPTIYRVLAILKNEGKIDCIVPGRLARWKRI